MKAKLTFLLISIIIQNIVFGFTLIIDPGHGGDDRGASQGTIQESEIALNVALKLANKFKNDQSINVVLTRPSDVSLSLKKRVDLNELYNGDLFMSLHVNSSTDSRAKGADFYIGSIDNQTVFEAENHAKGKPLVDSIVANVNQTVRLYQSQYLASDSFESWKTSLVTLPRSIKQGPFYVINRNKTPSVLVEFGFITNSKEALELIKEENQDSIAKSLYLAVKNYQKRVSN